jgi:hypothetical protein
MQANKDQDWTDDADFWNEAWADMNTRLDDDGPGRRKGLLAWWKLYLAATAGLVLALVIAYGMFPEQTEDKNIPSTPAIVAEQAASTQVNTKDNAVIPTTASTERASTEKSKSEAVIGEAADNKTVLRPTKQTAKTAQFARQRKPDAKPTLPANSTADLSSITPVPTLAVTEVKAPAASMLTATDNELSGRKAIPASPLLMVAAIDQISTPALGFRSQVLPLKQQRYPNPLTLEGAYTSSFNLQQPGFLVGLGYRIRNKSKLSFPVSLRYRLDQSEFKDPSPTSADQASVPINNGNQGQFLQPVSISTDAVELGAGLSWAVAPRLRFSTGLSVAYQLRALVNFEGSGPTGLINQQENFNRELFSLEFDRSQDLLSSFNGSGLGPDFSRWVLRANAGVAYDIWPRLGVNFRATHLLRQPDRAQVLGLQTGRMEAGISYRLR